MKNCFIQKSSTINKSNMPLAHSHSNYEFYFLFSGKTSVNIESETFQLSKNDILLIPPSLFHQTNSEERTRYLLNFTPDYLNEYELEVVNLCQQQTISMTVKESEMVFDILEKLLSLQNDSYDKNPKYKDFNYNTCFSFLLYTISILKDFPTQPRIPQKGYSQRNKKIISYINSHLSDKLTLTFFCKMFFISPHVLCDSFKKDTNMTIKNFILKSRLKKAQEKLMYSDKKINQISEECGFSSPNYFNLIFTKHFKVSPSAFRKSNKIIVGNIL